jgi:CW-type Zinc Finger
MEERVYGRCVNKTGIALRVIDQMSITRCFTERELQDLMQNFQWAQCDGCEKWRVLIGVSGENLPEKWYCSMNTTDPINNNCKASEKSQQWYENKYDSLADSDPSSAAPSPIKNAQDPVAPERAPEQTINDEIMEHLLGITEENKTTTLVSQHYFHEALMETTKSSDELEKARDALATQKANEKDAAVLAAGANGTIIAIEAVDQSAEADASLELSLVFPAAVKAPSTLSDKVAQEPSKPIILSPTKRPALEGEKLGTEDTKPPSAQAGTGTSAIRRIWPTSLDGKGESFDGDIKVEEMRKRPAKPTESPNKKHRPSTLKPEPVPAAAAPTTGACKENVIDLCNSSDDDS